MEVRVDVPIAETERKPVAMAPRVLAEAMAGRDDPAHARGVDAQLVLADIDRKLEHDRQRWNHTAA